MSLVRKFVLLAAVAVMGAGLTPAKDAAAQTKWKMATSWGGGPLMEIGAKALAEQIEFLTEGRIKVQVFPSGTLSKGLDVRSAAGEAVAEAGRTWRGWGGGKAKDAVLVGGYAGSMGSAGMLHGI